MMKTTMKLAGAFSDKARAANVAEHYGGMLVQSNRDETAHLPFAALVLATTDLTNEFVAEADVGAYLVCERTVKNEPLDELAPEQRPGCVGVFTMVAHPGMGAKASDAHWRDKHAPLALEVHQAMTHYYQLSVQHAFAGPDWNGFAFCCFANEDDLRNRFFATPEGEKAVGKDVATFADTKKSPRRVIAEIG